VSDFENGINPDLVNSNFSGAALFKQIKSSCARFGTRQFFNVGNQDFRRS